MSISAEKRRSRILDAVRSLGTVRVVALAERLDLPAVTVRRDLAALAESGLVHRSHGTVSSLAAQLSPQAGPTLGLLVPTVSQYFDEVITGARRAAADAGAQVILGISSYDASADQSQVETLLDSGAQALILTPNWKPLDDTREHGWVADLPVPTILLERRPTAGSPAFAVDSVSSDHHYGALLALRHLAALGHERVLLAARLDTWTALKVRSGYAEGCALLGMTAEPVVDVTDSFAHAGRAAATVVDAVKRGVRAVLVHNDQDAIQLIPLLRTKGLSVPHDVALVSYDDVVASLGAPPLTAVAPPKRAVGEAAVRMALGRFGVEASPVQHLELLPELVVRGSCGGASAV
ncbi:LacI family DNA-binding transcriptional regulator [Streptomyces sp. NPDC051907]|uniref:LacI family DNA-binding transcriptional regulator n=1 Tax=Streptomyces sp. NPDC051907 TaxID=3155284 RepID=UPI0034488FA7